MKATTIFASLIVFAALLYGCKTESGPQTTLDKIGGTWTASRIVYSTASGDSVETLAAGAVFDFTKCTFQKTDGKCGGAYRLRADKNTPMEYWVDGLTETLNISAETGKINDAGFLNGLWVLQDMGKTSFSLIREKGKNAMGAGVDASVSKVRIELKK